MAPLDPALQTGRSDPGYSSPRTARSHSISSDRPSLTGSYGGLLSPPTSTSPDPAFIAASAASQIVTNDHDSHSDSWFDQHGIEPSGETALVAPPALKLVNRFLDQLLFNFLSVSRSTSLASLRPAVCEVLKPKLAKDAISGADQELHEYLGGGEDEELLAFHNGLEPSGDWDLELVWKRTRLRCMVYSSLGDMEEEDEDFYTEQDQLDGPPGSSNRFSNNPGVVSPAVAIFLTSILEFMGEQVLVVAGQAAYYRLRLKHEREERDGSITPAEIAERVVVEESDMERVALDRTLGRLWRGWKKRIRSPTTSVSMMTRSFSRESMRSQPQTSRAGSVAPEERPEGGSQTSSLAAILAEHEHAASVPLPLSADDVREIEIPGLVQQSDDEDEAVEEEREGIELLPRPKSLVIFTHSTQLPQTPSSSQQPTPIFLIPSSRKRSHSLPSPAPSVYSSPTSKRLKVTEIELSQGGDVVDNHEVEDHEVQTAIAVNKVDEEHDDGVIEEQSNARNSLIASAVAGVVAIGTAAAAAGITAAAHGQAPGTESTPKDAETEEDLNEEPQIMTSSRISIGGRVSPDDPQSPPVPSRRSSARSHSVHSLRLIDVTSPKSPAQSRSASVDTNDNLNLVRGLMGSRPSSVHSPATLDLVTPRVASPISRIGTASPIARNSSALSSKATRASAEESISEVEEPDFIESDSEPETAVPSDLAAAMQGVDVWSNAASPQYISEPANRDVKPQPSTFVLSPAPAARNARGNPSTHLNNSNVSFQPSTNLAVSKPRGVESGIPPLTPLREMMEGAPDTSDEASSVAPSYDSHSVSEHGMNGHSPSLSASSLPQRSLRQPTTNTSRNSPPRSNREDQGRKDSRPQRSIHTSGSGSSSASHKLKPVRTSEDSVPSAIENKGQSFEQLIRSDQTIQYTLTPQNMRDIEAPDSPRQPLSPVRVISQDGPRPPTGQSHSSSAGKYSKQAYPEPPHSPKVLKTVKAAPRQAPNTGARLRPNAPQARDARVDRESMGDFAEFIKSTGPANVHDQPIRSIPAINGHRGMNGTTRNASGSEARAVTASTLPRRADSSAGKARLQARDAVVSRSGSISDLIDFVRSGPQLEKENHRIPRTVAPFRTTMDSDQMSGAVGGKAIDATLPDPRYSQASTSVHSSVTSQTALLNSSTKTNRHQPAQNNGDLDEEDMIPKRKTRRVRDVYQIDFSDEEDEYEFNPKPHPIQEESLADFLRNVPPPPESNTSPVFETSPRPASRKVKKKSSTPSIMSRFSRTNAGPQPPQKPKSSGQDSRSTTSRTGAPQLPNYTPIAVQFSSSQKQSTYEPARGGNYVSQLDSARSNKVPQKSYQPREAVYSTARTNDLANFLRDSEPPSTMHNQPQTFSPALHREEASTFQRMFGRKKAH